MQNPDRPFDQRRPTILPCELLTFLTLYKIVQSCTILYKVPKGKRRFPDAQLQHTVHHQFAHCATYRFERPRSSLGLPLQLLLMVHHWFARCVACPSERPGSFLGLPLQLQLTTAHDPSLVCTLHHLSFPKAQKLSTPSRMLHRLPFQKAQKLSTPSCVLCRFPFQKTQKLSRPFTTTTAGPLLICMCAHISHTYTLGTIL